MYVYSPGLSRACHTYSAQHAKFSITSMTANKHREGSAESSPSNGIKAAWKVMIFDQCFFNYGDYQCYYHFLGSGRQRYIICTLNSVLLLRPRVSDNTNKLCAYQIMGLELLLRSTRQSISPARSTQVRREEEGGSPVRLSFPSVPHPVSRTNHILRV